MIFFLLCELLLGFALLIVCMTKLAPWRIQLILKEKFPNLSPTASKICYYAMVSLFILLIIHMVIFVSYYGSYKLNFSSYTVFFFVAYTFIYFWVFCQHFYVPSRKWQADTIYIIFVYLATILYFVIQLVTCAFAPSFNENDYSAIYLEINFFFIGLGIQSLLVYNYIETSDFCLKFIQYLETVTSQEGKKELNKNKAKEPLRIQEEQQDELRRGRSIIQGEELISNINITTLCLPRQASDKSNHQQNGVSREDLEREKNLIPTIINSKADLTILSSSIKKGSGISYILIAVNIGTISTLIVYSITFMYFLSSLIYIMLMKIRNT